jgi:hypothetical protein
MIKVVVHTPMSRVIESGHGLSLSADITIEVHGESVGLYKTLSRAIFDAWPYAKHQFGGAGVIDIAFASGFASGFPDGSEVCRLIDRVLDEQAA